MHIMTIGKCITLRGKVIPSFNIKNVIFKLDGAVKLLIPKEVITKIQREEKK